MTSQQSIHHPEASRQDLLVVLTVVGLSAVTGVLYLWAVSTVIAMGAEPGIAPLSHYGLLVTMNVLSAGLLWWHRRHPLIVFTAIFVIYAAGSFIAANAGNGGLALPLWFSVYAVAAYARPRAGLILVSTGWIALVALQLALAVGAGIRLTLPETGLAAFSTGFFFIACFAIGMGFRLQHRRTHEAAEHARLIEERSRALNAEAVAKERNRMARELHDLAAHELMDVLLSIRAMRLTDDDPTLPEIERKTSRALSTMRSVVRTLREPEGDDPARAPLPDAATHLIDALAEERDLTVNAHIDVPVDIGDAVASTTLSVLKEALLNAAAHAPGATVTVILDADEDSVRLTVINPSGDPRAADRPSQHTGTGYGLVGAAERAELLAGRFEAGPTQNGEWHVTLQLPAAELAGEIR